MPCGSTGWTQLDCKQATNNVIMAVRTGLLLSTSVWVCASTEKVPHCLLSIWFWLNKQSLGEPQLFFIFPFTNGVFSGALFRAIAICLLQSIRTEWLWQHAQHGTKSRLITMQNQLGRGRIWKIQKHTSCPSEIHTIPSLEPIQENKWHCCVAGVCNPDLFGSTISLYEQCCFGCLALIQ